MYLGNEKHLLKHNYGVTNEAATQPCHCAARSFSGEGSSDGKKRQKEMGIEISVWSAKTEN